MPLREAHEGADALALAVETGRLALAGAGCRYADGTRVLGATTLELRDGRIARESVVQAWDE